MIGIVDLPHELLALILARVPVTRRVALLNSCRCLRARISLFVDYVYPSRPAFFVALAATGATDRLAAHAWHRRMRSIESDLPAAQVEPYVVEGLVIAAASSGRLPVLEFISQHHPLLMNPPPRGAIDAAAENGHAAALRYLLLLALSSNLANVLAVAKKIFDSLARFESVEERARMAATAAHAVAQSVVWTDLFSNGTALKGAAANGHTECVRIVIETGFVAAHGRDAIQSAVDAAAGGGYLEIIKPLVRLWNATASPSQLASLPPPCTEAALTNAAKNGHLAILKYLFKILHVLPLTEAPLDAAAGHGHLACVRYLHTTMRAKCTPKAMDFACLRGHLETVQYLHEHRHEGCTPDALNYAASRGNLDVVRFLVQSRREGRVSDAVRVAQKAGQAKVVAYLIGLKNGKR
ncbi:hypothetical protein HDU83_000025 [Entophlyctis luteolus]|nr:hypothetical protein HDU83_000025 [Entophlyctis luteolus]